MGLPSAVDWWEDWHLRILVLASQSVQWILFLSARRRKSGISAPFRVLVWLSYLGSDAMVIYALAALFYRQKNHYANPSFPHGNRVLETVWAPVLLMHLGGQYCITAYNMEDNDLWRRHALIGVSQITVSIYVFCRSWKGGDRRLLQAAIMLFTIGVIRCLAKPFALKKASINSLAISSDTTTKPSDFNTREAFRNSVWNLYHPASRPHTKEAPTSAEAEAKDLSDTTQVQVVAEAGRPCLSANDTTRVQVVAEASGPSDIAGGDDIEANLRSVREEQEDGIVASGPSHIAGGDDIEANLRSVREEQEDGIVASGPSHIAGGDDIEANLRSVREEQEDGIVASRPSDDNAQVQGVGEVGEGGIIASHPSDDTAQVQGVGEEGEDCIVDSLPSDDIARVQGVGEEGEGGIVASLPSDDTAQVQCVGEEGEDCIVDSLPSDDTAQVQGVGEEGEGGIVASLPSDDTAQVQGVGQEGEDGIVASDPSDTAPVKVVGEASQPSDGKGGVGSADQQSTTYRCTGEQVRDYVNKLFVDLPSPYSDRLGVTQAFLSTEGETAYELLQKRLSETFDLLYTKANMVLPDFDEDETFPVFCAHIFRFACMVLPFAAIGLFHRSNREAYDDNDVKVTYTLLCCTAVMELFSYPPFADEFADEFAGGSKLSGTVAQYSFIGFFARNKKYSTRMSVLNALGCKEYVNQQWPMNPVNSTCRITMLVRQQVRGWWNHGHIRDAASYTRFNSSRGQWAIEQAKCGSLLGWSIERSFDESVLLWHIATDLCFHNMGLRSYEAAKGCREISNYMMYLLFAKPEMLMAGTRPNLLKVAYKQLDNLFGWEEPVDEREIAQILIDKVEKSPEKDYFVHYAWGLAKQLMDLNDQKKMWEVIQGVWVEMLCYSASRCRGYLHAQSLGTGGELLTFVWLLWSHMGMETLAESLQMPAMELKKKSHTSSTAKRSSGNSSGGVANPASASAAPKVPLCPPAADTLVK